MSEQKHIKVGFIGAGAVNFGGHGNAWDHATRVEKMPNVSVVGISELDLERAELVLTKRRLKTHVPKEVWEHTQIFKDYKEMIEKAKPDAVFIGLPPHVHGQPKFPVELDCVNAGIHILIEKPLSSARPEVLKDYHIALQEAEKRGVIISVAYMFRYSKVINVMKETAKELGPVRYFNARYHCAYSKIGAEFWWNAALSGGPLVEQATHFIDLARYLCGDIEYDSMKCTSITANDPLSELSQISIDENKIPVENRPNRVTSAMWKFESGAVGNLTHTALLHGWRYELQLELVGDGYYVYVHNPYDECRITIRRPDNEQEVITAHQDDPYLHEVERFFEAIRTNDPSKIASSYTDAYKTYEASWRITDLSKTKEHK